MDIPSTKVSLCYEVVIVLKLTWLIQSSDYCFLFYEVSETQCQRLVREAEESTVPLVGAFIPECLEDGSFAPRQCHGSINSCWCVDEAGQEIAGTRKFFGETSQVVCNRSKYNLQQESYLQICLSHYQ